MGHPLCGFLDLIVRDVIINWSPLTRFKDGIGKFVFY